MEIAEFVKARLDEDEWIAQGAARTDDGRHGHWLPVHFGAGGFDARVDDHIARHDPARVLREVAAKRAILARHKSFSGSGGTYCAWCSDGTDTASLNFPWPCPDIRDLVAVYSDHPDYRAEWTP